MSTAELVVLLAGPGVRADTPDPTPVERDIVAGWGAFAVFIGLIVVVALLGWSLARQLRKVEANRRAGVYDDAAVGDGVAAGDGAVAGHERAARGGVATGHGVAAGDDAEADVVGDAAEEEAAADDVRPPSVS